MKECSGVNSACRGVKRDACRTKQLNYKMETGGILVWCVNSGYVPYFGYFAYFVKGNKGTLRGGLQGGG